MNEQPKRYYRLLPKTGEVPLDVDITCWIDERERVVRRYLRPVHVDEWPDSPSTIWWTNVHGIAKQKTEAFLRTLSLWDDSK